MLNYETIGHGEETLVLLHGFMENLSIWNEMIPHLSDKFKIIRLDLPGHGQSEMIDDVQTMELMAEAVVQTLESVGTEFFHILGHSMGGYISLALAEKYPERLKSLTLFFSNFLADSEEKKEQRRKSFRIIKEAFPGYVRAGVPNLFNPHELDELQPKIALAKSIALGTNNLGALACAKGMVERPTRTVVLENLNQKILILAGRHDNAVNAKEMMSQIPDKKNTKAYLLDCGHNGHWERPEICAQIINYELLKK